MRLEYVPFDTFVNQVESPSAQTSIGSLPPACELIYSQISSSWAVRWIDTQFLKVSVPIIQNIYQKAGEINKLTRPLNAVWYLCLAIELSQDNDNHFEGCKSLVACRNLTALMLYDCMRDLNPSNSKDIIAAFQSQVPTDIFWWCGDFISMYTIPPKLYIDDKTSQPFQGYTSDLIAQVSDLDDNSRILFMCSVLSDMQNNTADVPQVWFQDAYNAILVNKSLSWQNQRGGIERLYQYLILQCQLMSTAGK
ncbi:MAG: hypothetical protein WC222_08420 [Parachlamydiales bacterium]|jgi:hypothetical protein